VPVGKYCIRACGTGDKDQIRCLSRPGRYLVLLIALPFASMSWSFIWPLLRQASSELRHEGASVEGAMDEMPRRPCSCLAWRPPGDKLVKYRQAHPCVLKNLFQFTSLISARACAIKAQRWSSRRDSRAFALLTRHVSLTLAAAASTSRINAGQC
jgi:hypothetical protein